MTSIGNEAFSYCRGLTSITIPNSVTSIGNEAFSYCRGLTSITIPNSVTSIGYRAFYNCEKLVKIYNNSSLNITKGSIEHGNVAYYAKIVTTIKNANEYINIDKFLFHVTDSENILVDYTGNDTKIILPENCEGKDYRIKMYAFYGYSRLTSVTIPNSVTSIGNEAFYNCTGLTSITIPNSVTSIGNEAFYGCTGLGKIVLESGNPVYDSREDCNAIIETETNTLIQGCKNTIIPNSVTRIENYSFSNCTGLRSVTIPNSVTSISSYAFSGCTGLTNIYILSDSIKIGGYAFSGCKKTTNVYVTTEDLANHFSSFNIKYIMGGNTTATTMSFKNNIPNIIEFSKISSAEQEGLEIITGLNPETTYKLKYTAETVDGYKITGIAEGTTDALTFKTLPAKATSNTRAVICAEANIANEETGVGFEWRRIDAPDLVPSNYAACAVNDSTIEGVLNNLSANTYYKYRPYYCSAAGKYYYGEWIGFGTADAYVYFTPTVHTYEATVTASNAARLYGYALAGSDDVIEQGFEYWADGLVTRSSGDVMTVTGSGQRMNVLLENLEYGTVYKYRTYVKTANETVYGEIKMFETSYPVGIEDVTAADEVSISVHSGTIIVNGLNENDSIQVYTLQGELVYNGHDYEIAVESGIYIVKVGDTAKKVLVK